MTATPTPDGPRGPGDPREPARLDLRLAPALASAWGGGAVLVAAEVPVLAAVAAITALGALAALRWSAATAAATPAADQADPPPADPAAGPAPAEPADPPSADPPADPAPADPAPRAPAGSLAGTVALASAVLCAVAVSALAASVVRDAGLLAALAREGSTARVEFVVTADPRAVWPPASAPGAEAPARELPPRWVVRARAEHVAGAGRSGGARAPVLVVGGPGWAGVQRGQRVSALVVLEAAPRSDDVRAVAVAGPPATVAAPTGWYRAVAVLRAGLQAACAPLPDDAGGLLPGLTVGDTSALPPDLEEAMRATGLTHLTAVSGSNVALVVGAALALGAAVGLRRRPRLALAALALAGFTAVAGPEPSVARAGVMGAVALVGLASARRGAGVPVLCTAGVVLLVADPWLTRSFGFALSVLATGALLLLARPWAEALSRWVPRWAALALAVPIAAQVVCGPVVLLLAEGVPLTAVPANLLVAPAVGPATVAGLGAAVLAPWWLGGAQVLAWIGGLATGWIALVARGAAAVPGGTAPWPSGWLGALALAAATVLVLSLLRALRPDPVLGTPGPAPGPAER